MTGPSPNDAMISPNPAGYLGRGPLFWGALFVLVMFGAAGTASFMLDGPARLVFTIAPMALLWPLVRASEARAAASGCFSPVIVRYNRRMLFASFGYVAGLGIAVSLWRAYDLADAAVFALAMLPTLPTFVMIWAMGRYLVEEQDEYLRYRTVRAALMSLGMVLALGIFWGFLEMFGLVPHVWAWWVLPAWAIGLVLANIWMKVRGA